MKVAIHWFALVVLVSVPSAPAQEAAELPTPLAQLVAEAQANNSRVLAATHAWKAATHAAQQVTSLPDPKITIQQFSVGSPRPFAGYTNSNFAFLGIGASQELPFPGKLTVRGKVADREADAQEAVLGVTRKDIADAVKSAYLQLAYLHQTLDILQQNQSVLGMLIQDAIAHYQVGQGMQQDVLQAQVERTKLVREITLHHQQVGNLEAQLKALLHRDQGSPDIIPEDLSESTTAPTATQLLASIGNGNPDLRASQTAVHTQEARLASAKRDGKPDFELGYMYQNTDRKYRDYYVATFSVSFPRKKRIDGEIAEAAEMQAQARESLDAQLQQQRAAVQQQYVQATSDAELLKEYREGLIPQSDAAYKATLNAYASSREPLTHVLQSFIELLNLRLEFAKTLADHEIALAHLESLTGVTLR